MTRASWLLPLAVAAAAHTAAAQTPRPAGRPLGSSSRARMSLTVNAGLTTGTPLWSQGGILLPVLGGGVDTLLVGRLLRPGLSFSLLTTYSPTPWFGWTVEAGWFGVLSEGRCSAIGGYRPSTEGLNQQACTSVHGQQYSTGLVTVQGGAIVRLLPESVFEPYVRAGVGPGLLNGPFVRSAGFVSATTCPAGTPCIIIPIDEFPYSRLTPTASLAAGASLAFQPGLRIHIEARDLVAGLPEPAGPPNNDPFQRAHVVKRVHHVVTVTAGLEVIMERSHRRRY